MGPIAKTESCQHRHAGYAMSGRLTVRMNDGTLLTAHELKGLSGARPIFALVR